MSEAAANRDLLKDFTHYAKWFVIWAVLFNFLQPISSDDLAGASFWGLKLTRSLYGVGFGVSCAFIFALLQNSMNPSRQKWLSWIFAAVVWFGSGLIVALSIGRL